MSNDWEITIIKQKIFQEAWIEACKLILRNKKEARNLIIQIEDITAFNKDIHSDYDEFCIKNNILSAKHVAYTIFPDGLYKKIKTDRIFEIYNKDNGIFDRIKTRWGTYFRRLTHYECRAGDVNQLGKIIEVLKKNKGKRTRNAAYSMIIPQPGSETIKPLGTPCLNYIALQIKKDNPDIIGMLAVYRNHDFLNRAYGNYYGLCNLLKFITDSTGYNKGPLTCLSSHAYIKAKKMVLISLSNLLDNYGN